MDRHAHVIGSPLGCHALRRGQPLRMSDLDLVHAPQPRQPRPTDSQNTRSLRS